MTKNTCKWILFGFIFLFLGPFLGITPSSATPQREDFPNPEVISYNVLSNVHPGAIILMHDGAEWEGDRTNTIKSLHQIIPTLKDQGLEFVTVPELVDIAYQQ